MRGDAAGRTNARAPDGWHVEFGRRGITTLTDDIGRECVTRDTARTLVAEVREAEARKVRLQQDIDRRAVAADEARRAALPKGVPADAVPAGMTAAELLMASDPDRSTGRRVSVLEDMLAHPNGVTVFRPVGGEAS